MLIYVNLFTASWGQMSNKNASAGLLYKLYCSQLLAACIIFFSFRVQRAK